ncbi:Twin-arginine translocation protein TatA [Minicystis rosea]|nr:Twin-arginine translocation protein TatA [Minicystis rosea]
MAHFLAPPPRDAADLDDDFEDEDDDDDDFEDEDVIPMTDAAVLELLRERCAGEGSFYLAPSIPARKERTVRALHAAHLPPNEPILALYDGTVFGSADDGFVLNAWRLCWKNFTEAPQVLLWHQIDPDRIRVDGNKIHIRAATIETYLPDGSDFMDVLEEVFPILARSARKATTASPRAATPAPQPVTPPPHGAYGPPSMQGHAPGGYGPPPSMHGQGYGPPPMQQGGYGPPPMHGGHGPPMHGGHGGYGPPQAQPVYGCWHCRAPIHWQSARCMRCGASPGPQGWPRIG